MTLGASVEDAVHAPSLFEEAEHDPEVLLSMSEEEFRLAIADAGFDVDELTEQFHSSLGQLFSKLQHTRDG